MTKKFDAIDFYSVEYSDDEIKLYYQKIGHKVQTLRQAKDFHNLNFLISLASNPLHWLLGQKQDMEKSKFSIEHLYKIAKVLHAEVKKFFE